MRSLSSVELLNVWEIGLTQQPIQRALTLLAAACLEASAETLASLSIGERDARLLTLREWIFGARMVSLAVCSHCNEQLELNFNTRDLRVAAETRSNVELSLDIDGYELYFRLPNSLDLVAVTGHKDIAIMEQLLLKRCILTARHNGEQITTDQLPAEVATYIVERMAQADPQADIKLALSCPSCTHQWQAIFDIESFFWNEINAWAQRILKEVHTLASAYGWRELDILNMSPWRRQVYLNLVGR
ncbi:MAG: phage baseplate protein [Acidobacteriota bacterium]